MYELKPLGKEAIGAAHEKAERYRLLNEPWHAESIYHDILAADAADQRAVVGLILALTDQFRERTHINMENVRELLPRLRGEYERAYYSGIISERWGTAQLEKGVPGHTAMGWLREAMRHYEQAEPLSPAGNAEAILRWNACARIIERCEEAQPAPPGMRPGRMSGDMPLE